MIIVGIAHRVRTGEQDTVDDAGMVEPIGKDHIPLPHQSRNNAGISGMTAIKNKRNITPFK